MTKISFSLCLSYKLFMFQAFTRCGQKVQIACQHIKSSHPFQSRPLRVSMTICDLHWIFSFYLFWETEGSWWNLGLASWGCGEWWLCCGWATRRQVYSENQIAIMAQFRSFVPNIQTQMSMIVLLLVKSLPLGDKFIQYNQCQWKPAACSGFYSCHDTPSSVL